MDQATFLNLLSKYLRGEASPEEEAFIDVYYRLFAQDQEVLQQLDIQEKASLQARIKQRIDAERATSSVSRHMHADAPAPKPRKIRLLWPYAAAVAVVILALAVFFIESRDKRQDTRLAATEILPGGNRATLTLADGRVVELSDGQGGIVVGGEGIKYVDGSDVWNQDERIKEEGLDALSALSTTVSDSRRNYYVLSTPRGGTYQITLPDGSKVWLNAASTLKYPERFDGSERVVELEGEAYFEVVRSRVVAKSQSRDGLTATSRISASAHQPFRVVSKGQTVEVLGTSFNISAYADEPETKTTLVEGKVRVAISPLEGGRGVTEELQPSQQAITTAAGIKKVNVNAARYTAWKEGVIALDHTDLPSLIRQLERWYDVSFEFPQGMPASVSLSGEITRQAKLSSILKMLEHNSDMKFTIKERRVMAVY